MNAEILAIISTIVAGTIVTVVVCLLLASRFRVELAVVGIVATVILAVLARPLERSWDWILGPPDTPISHGPASATPAPDNCKFRPDEEVPVSVSLRTTDPEHTQSDKQDGRYQLTFEPPLTWAGYLIDLPEGVCDYRLQLTAQLLSGSRQRVPGEGWGYGIGPCNVWTADAPRGFVLQYAAYQENAEQAVNNSGWFVNPDVNDGTPVPVPSVDNSEHHWVFSVRGNDVTVAEDFGQDIGTYAVADDERLPATCRGRDIFIRVFNASAVFTNIRVVGQ